MANPYKLKPEIKQFIIEQKRTNPGLSCRSLIPLIREHFQINLSKSLINNVIKQNNLSGPVGRRRIKEPIIFKQPFEIHIVRKEELIENGGCFFLEVADIKLSLSTQVFKKELTVDSLIQYCKQAVQSLPSEVKEYLLRLNSYVQNNFFPSVYQFLDFSAMQERFYSLWAKTAKKGELLEIKFFYPRRFPWQNDIVWHEDLSYAANRVNESRVFSHQKELIWLNPYPEILP